MAVSRPVNGSTTMVPRPLRYGNGSRKSRPVTRKHGNGAQPYITLKLMDKQRE